MSNTVQWNTEDNLFFTFNNVYTGVNLVSVAVFFFFFFLFGLSCLLSSISEVNTSLLFRPDSKTLVAGTDWILVNRGH